MFTTVVYSESLDTLGALSRIAPIPDQHMTIQNNAFIVPSDMPKLAAEFALGGSISRAQMQSPELRKTSLVDLPQLEIAVLPTDLPAFNDAFNYPRTLKVGEGLEAYVAETFAGAERETVVAWLMDQIEPVPEGEVEIVRLVGATTTGAFVWSLCPLVLGQQLNAGEYAIVGMWSYGATQIVGRLVLQGHSNRPGVISQFTKSRVNPAAFDLGRLGVFGTFKTTFLPQLEVFTTGIDTSQELYLALVKISDLEA